MTLPASATHPTTCPPHASVRVHLRHVRAASHPARPLCSPGIRAWCRRHDIDLHALCREGIAIAAYPHLHDDPFVARAIACALEERHDG